MNEQWLSLALRRALVFSLSVPLGAVAACGGQTLAEVGDAAPDDAATNGDGHMGDDEGGVPDASGFDVSPPRDASRDTGGDVLHNPLCTTDIPDGATPCGNHPIMGDPNSCERDGNGQVTQRQCQALCDMTTPGCSITPGTMGMPAQVLCFCGGGRAPAGLSEPELEVASELGAHFARMAHLEAAAVEAFGILERELVEHGAPATLVKEAKRAARDEVRHARSMGALARRFGAEVPDVSVAPAKPRTLEEIAIENAIEGCVRETYGAAVGAYQAEVARDAHVRRAMRAIAKDEERHAALGWAVSKWAESRLDDAGRARVRAARDGAVEELTGAVMHEPSAPLAAAAGLPSAAHARRLVSSLKGTIWS